MARDVKEKLFEIDSKKIELDFIQQQFLVECKRFIAQNFEGCVRSAVSKNPEKVISLGKKGLLPIKQQVIQLMDSVSDLVENEINTIVLWQHHNENLKPENFTKNTYCIQKGQHPEFLESAILKMLSPIGQILLEYEIDDSKNWTEEKNLFKYRHPLKWTPEMKRFIEQYNDRFNELAELVKEYALLSKKSAGNDALDLWDSI